MNVSFTDFNQHFFLNKTSDSTKKRVSLGQSEYIFFKDHGKNSTITVKIKNCKHKPVGLYVIIGDEKVKDLCKLEQLLETYSTSYDKAKKCYTWKGQLKKVSRRVDLKTYRIGFVFEIAGNTVTPPIRVLSKQKNTKPVPRKRKRIVCDDDDGGGETRVAQLVERLQAIVEAESAKLVKCLDLLSKRVTCLETGCARQEEEEEDLFETFFD